MPFKSKAQQRYMYARHPEIAEEFSEHMSHKDFEKLPEKKAKNQHLKDLSKKHIRKKSVY